MNVINKTKLFVAVTIIFLLFTSSIVAQISASISQYNPVFIAGYDKQGAVKIAIRSFIQSGKEYFLVVDPHSLKTSLVMANDFQQYNQKTLTTSVITPQSLANTPYFLALKKYSAPPYPLANDGLRHADHEVNGYFLTIDMCPAKKNFEADFFSALVDLANRKHQALPIALSMSGLWLQNHSSEFNWLLRQQAAGKLQITWVNHSLTHAYHPNLPLDQNFLLMKASNFSNEVLGLEKLLLAQGQLPSIFFRFPGLISDEKLILQLRSLGLIPLGTDAWLAKGEQAAAGSIILVHGNSNESAGIKKIMPLLPQANWLPLTDALEKASKSEMDR